MIVMHEKIEGRIVSNAIKVRRFCQSEFRIFLNLRVNTTHLHYLQQRRQTAPLLPRFTHLNNPVFYYFQVKFRITTKVPSKFDSNPIFTSFFFA